MSNLPTGNNNEQKSKSKNVLQKIVRRMSTFRVNLKPFRTKSIGSQSSNERKDSLERALMLRVQKWGQSHNLPDWAQQKMARALIKEEERRKKRAELQARKEQLLRQATLKHQIVVGVKLAEEAKTKAKEANKIMPEMRKGDSALPYRLQSLELDSLVEISNETFASKSGLPSSSDLKTDADKQPKEDNDLMLAALIQKPDESGMKGETGKQRFDLIEGDESSILAYIEYLDNNDLWEQESNENALYNWIVSQTSPDDTNVEQMSSRSYDVSFDPIVVGRTYPYRKSTYDKDESSEEYETDLEM